MQTKDLPQFKNKATLDRARRRKINELLGLNNKNEKLDN